MADLRGLRPGGEPGRTMFLVFEAGVPRRRDGVSGPEIALDVEVVAVPGANPHLPRQRDPVLWTGEEPTWYPVAERDRIAAVAGRSGHSLTTADGRKAFVVMADPMFPSGPSGTKLPTRLRPSSIRPVPEALAQRLPVDLVSAQAEERRIVEALLAEGQQVGEGPSGAKAALDLLAGRGKGKVDDQQLSLF